MGWSFSTNPRYDRAALMRDLQAPGRLSPGYTMLKHRFVGNNHWYLYQTPEGKKVIGLNLMASGRYPGMDHKSGWGHKGMCEQSGLGEVNCPLSLLDEADEPERYAIEWRQCVRAYHAKRKVQEQARKSVCVKGAEVLCNGEIYTLVESLGRKGWRVVSKEGRPYRMSHQTLSKLEFVTPAIVVKNNAPVEQATPMQTPTQDLFGNLQEQFDTV